MPKTRRSTPETTSQTLETQLWAAADAMRGHGSVRFHEISHGEAFLSLGGEPKTEMWYIARAEPGAKLYAGLKAGVTRAEFDAALKAHFAKADADGNGVITAEERKAMHEARKERRMERRGQ